MYYEAIHAKYPNITIIASTAAIPNAPAGTWLDYHRYSRPDHMASLFNYFDNGWNRSNPVLVGEYAIIQHNVPGLLGPSWGLPQTAYSTMIGATSEAVFMIGAERNSDFVQGLSYAPLLQNVDSYEWTVSREAYCDVPVQLLTVS